MSSRKVSKIPSRKVRSITRQAVFNPSKGLNNYGAPNLIDDREWSDLLNIQFDESGVARKRYGYQEYAEGLTNGTGLGSLMTDSYNQVLTIDNTTFKYTTGTNWTTISTVGFQAGYEHSFTQVRGKTYIWNGIDGGTVWDGATISRPGTMPKGKFSIYYDGYHICSGVITQGSRIYIARLTDTTNDPSIFTNEDDPPDAKGLNNSVEVPGATVFDGTGSDYIDIQPEDGDSITGMGVFQDTLIIFKQFAIYQLTFDDAGDPYVIPITRAAGCVAHGSIKSVENDLYFLSRDGVRVLGNEANFYSAIRTNILSKRISTLTDAMAEKYFYKATAVYFNNEYILSIPDGSGALTTTIVYNKQFQSWTAWDNIRAKAFISYVNTDNELLLLFIKDTATQCYSFTPGVYSDNGAPINSFLLSKVFDFKSPDITKYFVDLGLMFRSITGELNIEIYTADNTLLGSTTIGVETSEISAGMGISMLGEIMFGLSGGEVGPQAVISSDGIRRVKLRTKSTSIRFKLSNNRNYENFVLLAYIHAFYPFTHYLFDSNRNIYL